MRTDCTTLEAGDGAYRLKAVLLAVGDDLLVTIFGGDRPHIGAVAVGRVDADGGVQVDTLTVGRHREGVVVEPAADRLAQALGKTVVVSAGMHWHQIDAAGISRVIDHARELVEKIVHHLQRG